MERQIKFSVFDAETKAHIGYERIGEHGHWEFKRDGRKEWLRGVITDGQVGKTHIRTEYTGLKDKSDKEIYKWDIVSYADGVDRSNECGFDYDDTISIGYVFWNDEVAGWDVTNKIMIDRDAWLESPEDREIIGNKLNNPELLNT